MKLIHVDEIESLPVLDGELLWKPVRHALDIDAFGINAYRGEKEGDLVVEDHADPHQELYLVVTGRALFRAGEEEFEASAGTFVLFQPGEQRVAHALEPGTTVVAVGAEAKRFEPRMWEYAFRAYGLWRLGRRDEANEALDEGLRHYPDAARLLYDRACLHSLSGEADEALADLARALAAAPELKERAEEDTDFDAIRDDPRFTSALAGEPDAAGPGS